eukprot:SAG31_NODE_247_length_19134_cov_12.255050_6_plen_1021_part_00
MVDIHIDSLRCAANRTLLQRGLSFDFRALSPGTSYAISVGVTLGRENKIWSDPVPFHTQLSPDQYAASMPMWASNASAEYVLFRRQLRPKELMKDHRQLFLAVSAKPSPDWRFPHGRNTSHLLCGYKLWVDGVPLGAGPGRIVGNARSVNYSTGDIKLLPPPIAVDTFNITSLVFDRPGNPLSTLAIEAYYRGRPSVPDHGLEVEAKDPDDRGGVIAVLHDGAGNILAGGADAWQAIDATPAFNPSTSGEGAGTGSYAQPHENIDIRLYPKGWRSAAFDGSQWPKATARTAFAASLAAKEALPVSLRKISAASFEILSQSTDERTGDTVYNYIIDYGRNFQGHVNVSFGSGHAGQQVTVTLGEQRTSDGVVYHAESNNVWIDTWTLDEGGSGAESFVPHEYAEFRWAEVRGAPEPPTHARVCGWQVHYPFDGQLNEKGLIVRPAEGLYLESETKQESSGLTKFRGPWSHSPLDQVWGLVRHTINAAALDLNTDSNTRQRDLCTLDAWLATRYQGGVAPGTACHLRRRVTENMYEPNGYVNYWTEFLVAHIGALRDYTLEYADQRLADRLWRQPLVQMDGGQGRRSNPALGIDNYTLAAYYNQSDHMVHNTPKPLIDWPRSDGIDTNGPASTYCHRHCIQMNAYAVKTHKWMAEITHRVGAAGTKETAVYAGRAEAIRAATHETFAAQGALCDTNRSAGEKPPLPPPTAVSTCAQEWEADTAKHHHGSTGVVSLNCGAGMSISAVLFADFGLPKGDCKDGFAINDTCHSDPEHSAQALVEKACLHRQYCSLSASDTQFGDSCSGVCKQLAVKVSCRAVANSDSNAVVSDTAHLSQPESDLHCYTDQATQDTETPPFTSATASSLAAYANIPGSACGVLKLLPFIAARNSRRGIGHGLETSGWMTGVTQMPTVTSMVENVLHLLYRLIGFMLEGLYTAAGDLELQLQSQSCELSAVASAVDFCHGTLTNQGNNSWLGMIRQNATMTMESWTQPPFAPEGGGTFSVRSNTTLSHCFHLFFAIC